MADDSVESMDSPSIINRANKKEESKHKDVLGGN